jgi:hypothetical protein
MLQFVRCVVTAAGVFAQEGNAAQLGAHPMVKILSDARSFSLQRAFLFQVFQSLLKLPFFHEAHWAARRNQEHHCRWRNDPPPLPEMLRNDQFETRPRFVPSSVVVGCNDAKSIFTPTLREALRHPSRPETWRLCRP